MPSDSVRVSSMQADRKRGKEVGMVVIEVGGGDGVHRWKGGGVVVVVVVVVVVGGYRRARQDGGRKC